MINEFWMWLIAIPAVLELLRSRELKQVLVFCGTRIGANRLAHQLRAHHIQVDAIHGDKSQPQRIKALSDFKAGAIRVIPGDPENSYLVQKLRDNRWNISATATAIGTPRSNLYKKLEQYGITEETDGLTSKAPGA